MTIEKELKAILVKDGLPDDLSDKVIAVTKADPENKSMCSLWLDKRDCYPSVVFALCWMSVRKHALKIIDAECPRHRSRNLFVNL